MVLKELTQAELAILAAGPPAHRLHDERVWRAERNKYDRLVRRQRELAKAAQPPRRSSRLEQKKLLVSDEWLAKEHPAIGCVEAGTRNADREPHAREATHLGDFKNSRWQRARRGRGGCVHGSSTRGERLGAEAALRSRA